MRPRVTPVTALVIALLLPGAAQAAPELKVQVLSDRADLISGGDALVAVTLPAGVEAAKVRVTAGGKDVTSHFAARPNGRFEALLENLPVGRTKVRASAPGAKAGTRAIVDHPSGGPVFAGPQVKPWVCQAGGVDDQCNQPVSYAFSYMPSGGGGFKPYDPENPPSDVATTTTDQGKTVPFIIREETGYQDRDQYAIAVLYDPAKAWTAWDPQEQFNHKLLITHGASCGLDHKSGEAPSVTTDTAGVPGVPGVGNSPTEALGRGFAVMSTALDNAGHNCNLVTQAESLTMAKERVVERYGELRYTIGTGCSGGSLTQQQVANAYPGIYQGILPQCSFPDAWSTGNQLVDYHQIRKYVEDPSKWAPGVVWDPASIAAVEGHPNHVNSIILDSLYLTSLGDPTNPCAGVSDADRWSPSNTGGVRCTLADFMVNVFGTRASDGYAGRPLDNVGLEYGLAAFKDGRITKAQFLDLNEKIGGADINAQPTAERTAADEPALLNAHRSGAINDTANLDQTAIIDLRGSDDGAFHDAYRAFAVRARLDREHGSHANQVIWQGPAPLIGATDFTTKGLLAMDRWLSAVEADDRSVPMAQKVAEDKPADIVDHCEDGAGQTVTQGTDCPAIVRVYATPRMVAGDSIATDTNKCRLEPLEHAAYPEFTDAEFAGYAKVFPGGVCDFSKPGVDADHKTIPWMTYDGVVGGKPLPAGGVPSGWSGAAFRGLRQAAVVAKTPAREPKQRIRILRVRRTGETVRITLRTTHGTARNVRVVVARRSSGKVIARKTLKRLTSKRRTIVLRAPRAGKRIRVKVFA